MRIKLPGIPRDLYIHAKIYIVKEADLDDSGQPAGTHIPS